MGTLMKRIQVLPESTFSKVAARGDYPVKRKTTLSLSKFE